MNSTNNSTHNGQDNAPAVADEGSVQCHPLTSDQAQAIGLPTWIHDQWVALKKEELMALLAVKKGNKEELFALQCRRIKDLEDEKLDCYNRIADLGEQNDVLRAETAEHAGEVAQLMRTIAALERQLQITD